MDYIKFGSAFQKFLSSFALKQDFSTLQIKVQFQKEIEELNSQLKFKDEQQKKFKEDNRLLLKRIAESKESKLSVVDNINTVCIY